MITVFTPTYNRAYCLGNLYKSLCEQTCREFEWLVVDDGSSDYTEQLVQSFMAEQEIDIRYIRQENGGKHRAINRGVKEARGEFFFIVDSDDLLPKDSLAIVKEEIKGLAKNIVGISGTRVTSSGDRVGGDLSFDTLVCNSMELRYKYHVKGDMAEVWRTDILRRYPFPTFEDEKFVVESVVWFRIAKSYDVKWVDKPIYVCEYREDGLTHNIRRIHRNSPLGSMLYCLEMIDNKQVSLLAKVKAAINYWRYTIPYKGDRPVELRPRWWMSAFWLPGYVFYRKDIRQ